MIVLKKLEKAFNKKKLSVKPNGILDNLTLHQPNEAARHKLLDVIGDLALTGTRIRGKVIANKPGHFVNTQFAKKLSKIIKIDIILSIELKASFATMGIINLVNILF